MANYVIILMKLDINTRPSDIGRLGNKKNEQSVNISDMLVLCPRTKFVKFKEMAPMPNARLGERIFINHAMKHYLRYPPK